MKEDPTELNREVGMLKTQKRDLRMDIQETLGEVNTKAIIECYFRCFVWKGRNHGDFGSAEKIPKNGVLKVMEQEYGRETNDGVFHDFQSSTFCSIPGALLSRVI